MKTTTLLLAAAVGAALVAGCAGPVVTAAPEVKPFAGVRHGGGDLAAGYYQLGRFYQGQGRLDLAADAYRKALVEEPRFAEAHNALGVILAGEGRFDAARAEFEAALAAAPRAAHVYNNLGWALYLQGDAAAAVAAFERSTALDPANPRAWNNLGLARAKLGEPQKAQDAYARALDIPKVSLARADALASTPASTNNAGMPASAPVTAGTARAVPDAAPPPATTSLIAIAPNVYELRWPVLPEIAAPAAPLAAAPAASAPAQGPYRLEVSNGNGATGMARRVGQLLADAGEPKARLTNHKPFAQAATEIQFRAGHEAAAAALRGRIPGSPATVTSASLRFDVDVRLLLGKDLRGDVALVEPAKRVATADRVPATRN